MAFLCMTKLQEKEVSSLFWGCLGPRGLNHRLAVQEPRLPPNNTSHVKQHTNNDPPFGEAPLRLSQEWTANVQELTIPKPKPLVHEVLQKTRFGPVSDCTRYSLYSVYAHRSSRLRNGNDHFKRKNLPLACRCYEKGLEAGPVGRARCIGR